MLAESAGIPANVWEAGPETYEPRRTLPGHRIPHKAVQTVAPILPRSLDGEAHPALGFHCVACGGLCAKESLLLFSQRHTRDA